MNKLKTVELLINHLHFPEAPRWRDGYLWFSDIHDRAVKRVNLDGKLEKIFDVPGWPGGLGWLPNGKLLVVSMTDKKLLIENDNHELELYADLSKIAPFYCNDMVVSSEGRAYIGNFGFNTFEKEPQKSTFLICVDEQRNIKTMGDNLLFPNGMVITHDQKTLIVAESLGHRLTAFAIEENGELTNQRIWAELDAEKVPDGLALDNHNGVWAASTATHEVLRVVEGGNITERVPVSQRAYACAIGGLKGHTLFILSSESSNPEFARAHTTGRIETFEINGR